MNAALMANMALLGNDLLAGGVWRRRALWFAAVWFVLCLLWSAPAQLLVLLIKPLVPQLQLHNVSGGFWNGAAAQVFWQQDGKVVALGKAQWRINPWSLLWLHPGARVSTSYGEQFIDTRVRLSPLGRVALRDTSAAIPAQLIGYWLPLPAKGVVAVKLQNAEFSREYVRALAGDIYWQQAQWQWGRQWLALGDYRCALRTEKTGVLRCALQGQGALAGGGDLSLDANKKTWSADMRLQPAATLPDEFRQTITVMLAAKADAQGHLQIKKSGSW